MTLDLSEVERIAILARIRLTDEEVETLRRQLSDILEQFQVLNDLGTAGVTATGYAVQLQTVMRDDVPDSSLEPEEVLSNAPHREGEFFRVKPVLEE